MEVEQSRVTLLDWECPSLNSQLDAQQFALWCPELGGRSRGRGVCCLWPVQLVGQNGPQRPRLTNVPENELLLSGTPIQKYKGQGFNTAPKGYRANLRKTTELEEKKTTKKHTALGKALPHTW